METEIEYWDEKICNTCKKTFTDLIDLREHKIEHIKKYTIGSYDIFYLSSKEDGNCVLTEYDCYDFKVNNFDKYGWYYVHVDQRPCPRGCCYDTTAYLDSADHLIYKLKQDLQTYKNKIQSISVCIKDLDETINGE